MSFPKYPEYKDSGVEWLGQVPAHWRTVQLRHVLTFSTGWTPPTSDASSFEGDNLWANISDLGERVIRDTAKRISDHAVASAGVAPVEAGSLLYSFKLSIGQVSFAGQKMYTNEAIAAFPPNGSIDLRYAYYALPFLLEKNAAENIYGAKLLNQALIKSAALLLPPVAEQSALASFLDRETAKIDALVAEQGRLVALLREKRQAVISHAVTKGLNPNAPMKDSGIEWIGSVPQDWPIVPLRSVARLESGHTPSRQRPEWWVDCTVPWFTLSDVWQIRDGKSDVVFETAEKVSELGLANSSARLLPAGTVMLSRTASVGFSAIMGVPMATTQDFANWVCGQGLVPEYLLYVFRAMTPEFERLKMGSTHNTIYMPDIAAFRCPLPSIGVQRSIVTTLKASLSEIDRLITETEHALSLLAERRSSLITAAVTGQINVREHAPVETA